MGLFNYIKENSRENIVDTTTWGKFSFEMLFTINRPIARALQKYPVGEIPFVASGNFNNGIEGYISPNGNEALDKGNCITISPVTGYAFYQPVDFAGRGGAGSSIIKLYNENLNKNNSLFICAVIRKIASKYSYSNMLSADKIKKEYIYLPVDENGDPNWLYMEQYINGIYGELKNLVC